MSRWQIQLPHVIMCRHCGTLNETDFTENILCCQTPKFCCFKNLTTNMTDYMRSVKLLINRLGLQGTKTESKDHYLSTGRTERLQMRRNTEHFARLDILSKFRKLSTDQELDIIEPREIPSRRPSNDILLKLAAINRSTENLSKLAAGKSEDFQSSSSSVCNLGVSSASTESLSDESVFCHSPEEFGHKPRSSPVGSTESVTFSTNTDPRRFHFKTSGECGDIQATSPAKEEDSPKIVFTKCSNSSTSSISNVEEVHQKGQYAQPTGTSSSRRKASDTNVLTVYHYMPPAQNKGQPRGRNYSCGNFMDNTMPKRKVYTGRKASTGCIACYTSNERYHTISLGDIRGHLPKRDIGRQNTSQHQTAGGSDTKSDHHPLNRVRFRKERLASVEEKDNIRYKKNDMQDILPAQTYDTEDDKCSFSSLLLRLKTDLLELKRQDQELARQLLDIHSEIQIIKVNTFCQQHKEQLEDAMFEAEMADELPDMCDVQNKRLSTALQSHGVTWMNVHSRRFSCS